MSDPYQRLSKRELYRNPWLAVEAHEIVHPHGEPGEHVLVATGHASGILVVDGEEFVLARQPRFAAKSVQLEIVKGGADVDESALECAKRELREELGIEAREWRDLGIAHEIPSIVDHPVTLFVASDITWVQTEMEAVERVEPVRIRQSEAYEAALNGDINDAITIAAFFRYRSL